MSRPRYDKEAVLRAARGSWLDIFEAAGLEIPKKKKGNKLVGPCPICKTGDDKFNFDDKGGDGTWIYNTPCGCHSVKSGNGLMLLELSGMAWPDNLAFAAQYCNVPPLEQKKPSWEETKKEALSSVKENALVVFADSLGVTPQRLQQVVSQGHLGWRYGKPLWIWPGTFQTDNSLDAGAAEKYGKRPFEKGRHVKGFWRHDLVTKQIDTIITTEGCKDGVACLEAELENETTIVVAAYSENVFSLQYTKKRLEAYSGKIIILGLDKDAVEKRSCHKKAAARFYELGAKEVWFFSWENIEGVSDKADMHDLFIKLGKEAFKELFYKQLVRIEKTEATEETESKSSVDLAIEKLTDKSTQTCIFFDGKGYAYFENKWSIINETMLKRILKVDYELRDRSKIGAATECDFVIRQIYKNHVEGIGAHVGSPSGILLKEGKEYLNIWRDTSIKPASEVTEWGEKGRFPWLSQYLDTVFDNEEIGLLLAWWQRAQRAIQTKNGDQGQALMLVGEAGSGKSFFTWLLGEALGGSTAGKRYFSGDSKWTSDVLGAPLIIANDPPPAREKSPATSRIKGIVADAEQSYEGKYINPHNVIWNGRIVITANNERKAASAIPKLTKDLLDKFIMFKVSRFEGFKSRNWNQAKAKEELPYFLGWLMEEDFSTFYAEEASIRARFGTQPYVSPSVEALIKDCSFETKFLGDLEYWLDNVLDNETAEWTGTVDMIIESMRDVSPRLIKGLNTTDLRELLKTFAEEDSQGKETMENYGIHYFGEKTQRIMINGQKKPRKWAFRFFHRSE